MRWSAVVSSGCCYFWIIALCCALSSANVIFQHSNGSTISLLSVAQKIGKNSRDFEPVVGVFGGFPLESGAPNSIGTILALEYRGWRIPYVETILTEWKKQYKPSAVIYFHRNNTDYWGNGFPQYITTGGNGDEIDFPIVNMNSAELTILEEEYYKSPNRSLTLTVTKEGYGMWAYQKDSGVFIFFTVTALPFAAVNVILAIVTLFRLQQRQSLTVLCLVLEILANSIRVLYAMDPAAPWSFWQYPIETVFLTISFPISLMSMVLLTLHWQDLVDFTSLQVSSALSRSRYPAILIAVLLVGLEVSSTSLRAADISVQLLNVIIGAIYLIVLGIYIIHVIFVSIKVLKFFKTLTKLNQRQQILRRFTIRSAISIAGAVLMLSAAVATFFGGANIWANFYSLYFSHIGLDFVSFFQILAFLQAVGVAQRLSHPTNSTNNSMNSRNSLSV